MVITLVVVMGIAWIGNVLFFDVNLIFVAYIMTIFIAGQGIIIFILFVPLSKQVQTSCNDAIDLCRHEINLGERCLQKLLEKGKKKFKTKSSNYE